MVHDVGVSWIESVTFTRLLRSFKLDGDMLTLKTVEKELSPGTDVTEISASQRA